MSRIDSLTLLKKRAREGSQEILCQQLLRVSWKDVFGEFYKTFIDSCQDGKNRIYLAFCGQEIITSKAVWWHIAFLDALICHTLGTLIKKAGTFNQHNVFRDSVLLACSKALIRAQFEDDCVATKKLHYLCDVIDIPVEWTKLDKLKSFIHDHYEYDVTDGSIFNSSLSILCKNPYVDHNGLPNIIRGGITRIYQQVRRCLGI